MELPQLLCRCFQVNAHLMRYSESNQCISHIMLAHGAKHHRKAQLSGTEGKRNMAVAVPDVLRPVIAVRTHAVKIRLLPKFAPVRNQKRIIPV